MKYLTRLRQGADAPSLEDLRAVQQVLQKYPAGPEHDDTSSIGKAGCWGSCSLRSHDPQQPAFLLPPKSLTYLLPYANCPQGPPGHPFLQDT